MKKVLFVAYQFPPRSGSGVHRSLNFIKELMKFGYEPVVVTVKEEDLQKYGYSLDRSLLLQLPENLEIIRLRSREPVKLMRFLMKLRIYRIFWFVFYPFLWDAALYWSKNSPSRLKEVIEENKIQIVYTSSSPFAAWIFGWRLKKRYGLKWVADLRDPFTDGYMWLFPGKFHWKMMRKWEGKMLSRADKVIVNTPSVYELFLKRGIVDKEKLTFITNGY